MQQIITGNAADAIDTRGWFVGDFLPPSSGIRKDPNVEIKWGVHKAGENKTFTDANGSMSISVLIDGAMDVYFANKVIMLSSRGQFVMWGPDEPHGSKMVKDSTVLTIRWHNIAPDRRAVPIGDDIVTGDAHEALGARGWFVGGFLPDNAGLLKSDQIEIKWADHMKGDARAEWSPPSGKTTACILIKGEYVMGFEDGERLASKCADYMIWGPEVGHTWKFLKDSTVVTVRW